MIYYVDGQFGNDRNDGLSRQTAFRTLARANELVLKGGDALLLKAGVEYDGCLYPKRERGTGMIRIDRYGVGEKPLIKGTTNDPAALALYNSHTVRPLTNGEPLPPVVLDNFDEVELTEIAVTNPTGNIGIHVLNSAGGAMRHVHVRGCEVHHVNDDRHTYTRDDGGIICTSWSSMKAGPGWFEDLLIEDNDVQDVCRTGILLTGLWANRAHKEWAYNDYVNDEEGWWPSKEVVVRGNYVNRTGGDGIFIVGVVDALMEWNTVYNIMTNVPKGVKQPNAGIWPQSSIRCVMQYNESAYAHKPDGCGDAQGFDVDWACSDTLIQFNYSHDNAGGALTNTEWNDNRPGEKWNGKFGGTVFRNNLSVNDGTIRGELICLWGANTRATFENNTFIASDKVDRLIEVSEEAGGLPWDVTVRRNIFVTNGVDNNSHLAGAENIRFEENLYWGKHNPPREWDVDAFSFDPQLLDPTAPHDGMGAIMNFIPQNRDLILEGRPATVTGKDLLGQDTDGVAYIGAMLPRSDSQAK